MSVEQIEWKDPGPSRRAGRGGGKNIALLAQLQAHPGRWAVVARGKSTGQGTWWRKEGCEVTSRRQDDGTVETYARWPLADATGPELDVPGTQTLPASSEESAAETVSKAAPAPSAAPRRRRPARSPAEDAGDVAEADPASATPVKDTVELPPPRTPALIGHHMGDCTCGRRDVLLDRDDLCILCRNTRTATPHTIPEEARP